MALGLHRLEVVFGPRSWMYLVYICGFGALVVSSSQSANVLMRCLNKALRYTGIDHLGYVKFDD